MAASDELRAKRTHKKKAFAVNDMTVAIGIASVLALFIFLAVNQTSQVKTARNNAGSSVCAHRQLAFPTTHTSMSSLMRCVCVHLNQGPLISSWLPCVYIEVPFVQPHVQKRKINEGRNEDSIRSA